MASWKTMITQLKIAINPLGSHADNKAKHRYASRTYENNIRSNSN